MSILDNPGLECPNEAAVSVFSDHGCPVTRLDNGQGWNVRIPRKLVDQAVESAPSKIVLGASDPSNTLELDAHVPRIHFGTGSETNTYLECTTERFVSSTNPDISITSPLYTGERGSVQRLCDSANLCNRLDNVDFFIRNVNVQDEAITAENKDVNVFFASLLYMTKHVQAGLNELGQLDNVLRLAQMVAGGEDAFRENPVISFIACPVKSPVQMVEDTAEKVIEIARRGVPLVISSSPQGGSTAPIQEEGIVSLINAEILSGIVLTQLVNPGTPVLYGAVPVRARLDTLHDLYGAPEFIHYNIDCVQMAHSYGIPVYSSAGVGDAAIPGVQATIEKLPAQLSIAQAGANYIHYAFGLLNRTGTFCPAQAVIDDANVGVVKGILRKTDFDESDTQQAVTEVQKVMASNSRLFARGIRKQRRKGRVSEPHALAGDGGDEVIENAVKKVEQIRTGASYALDEELVKAIHNTIPGLLSLDNFSVR